MADPNAEKPRSTIEALVGRPQVASDEGGRGIGPTLGEDVEDKDKTDNRIRRGELDAQLHNARNPPLDGAVRGGSPRAAPPPQGPTPPPAGPRAADVGAAAGGDTQNSEDAND